MGHRGRGVALRYLAERATFPLNRSTMPIELIDERGETVCPDCQGIADVSWCRDSDGEFEKTACRECAFIEIVDPANPELQGRTNRRRTRM